MKREAYALNEHRRTSSCRPESRYPTTTSSVADLWEWCSLAKARWETRGSLGLGRAATMASLCRPCTARIFLSWRPRLSSLSRPPRAFPLILFSSAARLLLPFSPISRLFCYTRIVAARRLSAIVVDNSNGRLFLNPLRLDNRSVSRREIIIKSHRWWTRGGFNRSARNVYFSLWKRCDRIFYIYI